MTKDSDPLRQLLESKKFDVEHALGIYAFSQYSFPAEAIYDPNLEHTLGEGVKKCHIYLIGFIPKIDLVNVQEYQDKILIDYFIQEKTLSCDIPIPEGMSFHKINNQWFLSNELGERFSFSNQKLLEIFTTQHGGIPFEVVYVGQAFGKDGSRHALDRLRSHETLQKIAIRGAPEGHNLQILLVEINPSNQTFTFFNPYAKNKSQGEGRISNGLKKLFGTDDKERTILYEASLIRYFQPKYNKEFKNSFPSTNMKVLSDCYDKDFSGLVAEFCFDSCDYALFSDVVERREFHIIQYDLHKEEDRKIFFGVF